jgi:SAM-dependent methyltransferase
MFSETAELYDVIYGQFKDYAAEAGKIAALLERFRPNARFVLDVACGTGEHARVLAGEFGYEVDGLDLEPEFVRLAQRKTPGGSFVCADMLGFSLDRRYDVVLCLFSSIGYARTLENVRLALERFRVHMAPDGVLIVEPWFEPDAWKEGFIHTSFAEAEGLKVCRMSHSRVQDRVSVLEFHYLIGRSGGIEHRREIHELGLFTTPELEQAFRDAGLDVVQYDPVGLIGRGLFVAKTAVSVDV